MPEGILTKPLLKSCSCCQRSSPCPISNTEPIQPTAEPHLSVRTQNTRPSIGESWNVNQLVNRKFNLTAQLSLHHDSLIQVLHYCICCTKPSIHRSVLTWRTPGDAWNPSLEAPTHPTNFQRARLMLLFIFKSISQTWTYHPDNYSSFLVLGIKRATNLDGYLSSSATVHDKYPNGYWMNSRLLMTCQVKNLDFWHSWP